MQYVQHYMYNLCKQYMYLCIQVQCCVLCCIGSTFETSLCKENCLVQLYMYICYAQSSDWINPQIVLCKVQIRALRRQSPDCLSACPRTTMLCTCTFNLLHVYVGLCILIGEWRIASETFEKWTKNVPIWKESQKEGIVIIKQGDDRLSIKTPLLHFS